MASFFKLECIVFGGTCKWFKDTKSFQGISFQIPTFRICLFLIFVCLRMHLGLKPQLSFPISTFIIDHFLIYKRPSLILFLSLPDFTIQSPHIQRDNPKFWYHPSTYIYICAWMTPNIYIFIYVCLFLVIYIFLLRQKYDVSKTVFLSFVEAF